MPDYRDRPWLSLYPDGTPPVVEPANATALAMFDSTVARQPDRPLIHYFDASFTAREIDELTDALACGLRRFGVVKGDRVVLHLQNVPQYVFALLATWKLGATVVSANPMYRDAELRLLVEDSGAKALIALESLYEQVGSKLAHDSLVVVTTSELQYIGEMPPLLAGVRRARHDGAHDLHELIDAHAGQRPGSAPIGPDDLAVLTYTSGTTGPPKGAMNTHANVAFASEVFSTWTPLGPEDRILGIAPLFHVIGLIAHIGVSLFSGASLILAARFDLDETARVLERWRPTMTGGSITVFIALMQHPAISDAALAGMTKVLTGGAPVPPAVLDAYRERCGVTIRPVYGLTETTAPSHMTPIGAAPHLDPATDAIAVGVPVPSTLARVVDEAGDPVPVGEVGEIAISGPQVVPGYWRKPQETAHAFPGGELRTGDIGYMDELGWFYVIDRKKDQINVSGYKVWPREVEDVLYEHPAVREAAVVGVADSYRGETVKAFVSLVAGGEATAQQLIDHCAERMAAYKYPRIIELLDELPKTQSGKILRRELRERQPS